ncbi:DUF6221 family protein [Streptomyces sp. NPDC001858]
MSDIADFLRARYAERRAIAEAAAALQCDPENGWVILDHSSYTQSEKRRWISPHIGMLHESEPAEHIVANNPAVVLTDLDAKLGIVDHYEKTQAYAEVQQRHEYVLAAGACAVALKILAQPYAGHPDHRGEEWTP